MAPKRRPDQGEPDGPGTVSPIDAALALEDRDSFLSAVADLDESRGSRPFSERPDALGLLGGLWALHLLVSVDGIGRFLAGSEGAAFHETLAWCERVGADGAATYLRAVAALYPGGRVPEDDGARYAVVEELETTGGKPDPLRRLDRQYAPAMDELADRVRDWLRAHRAEVAAAMEQAAREPPPPPPDYEADAAEIIAKLESLFEVSSDPRPETGEPPPDRGGPGS